MDIPLGFENTKVSMKIEKDLVRTKTIIKCVVWKIHKGNERLWI